MSRRFLRFTSTEGEIDFIATDVSFDAVGALRANVTDETGTFKVTFFDGYLFADDERSDSVFTLSMDLFIPEEIGSDYSGLQDWIPYEK